MPDEGQVEQEKTLLTWKARSRPYNPDQDKSRSVIIVLGVLISIILIFAGEWMLIVLMMAGAFYWYAQNRVPPTEVDYAITNKGVRAFGRVYLWWELKRWWIEPRKTEYILILDLVTGMMGRIYLPLGSAKQEEVEKILEKYLLHEKPEETTVDKMTKWLGEKFPLENKI